ncbi:MAG: glutathione S-transferase family protein [Sphingomonas sp.]
MLIIGSYVSPYVRKVTVALDIKGVKFEIDPIVPFYGDAEFSRLSPLRRIPVLVDGDLVLNDSTVIAEYVDEAYPDPPLMPRSPDDRARARWIEEYADSRLCDLIIWQLFYRRVIAPRVHKLPTDEALLAKVLEVELPEAMDWIEARAPADGFLFDHLCTADITVAAVFRNAFLAGWTIDPARWPRMAAWVARVWEVPAFARSIRLEQIMMTTRREEVRAALTAEGERVAERSHAASVAQASIMLEDVRPQQQ